MAACCRLSPATAVATQGPLIRNAQRVQCTWHTSSAPALSPCRAAGSSHVPQGPRVVRKAGHQSQRQLRATPESIEGSGENDETPPEKTATEPAQSTSTPPPTPPPSTSSASTSSRISPSPVTTTSSSSSGGDPASREVLDAFFLGRALAEVVLERVGSAVGEFLSDIGRAQAEQQQQIRQFQDEVQARAEEARQKAAKQTKGPGSS